VPWRAQKKTLDRLDEDPSGRRFLENLIDPFPRIPPCQPKPSRDAQGIVHEKRRVSWFSSTKYSMISQARSGVTMKQLYASRSARDVTR